MDGSSEQFIYLDPPNLPRWLSKEEWEKRLAFIDVARSDVADNRLSLSLEAIFQAKHFADGRIGTRSGTFTVYVTAGKIEDATKFAGSPVSAAASKESGTEKEAEFAPEVDVGKEGGLQTTAKIGKLSLGAVDKRRSKIEFEYNEGAVQMTNSQSHVQWTVDSAQTVHPYREYLLRTLSVDTVLAFDGPEKRGRLDIRLTRPEFFNSQGQAQPKIAVVLACWFNRVKWKDTMEFRIGSDES